MSVGSESRCKRKVPDMPNPLRVLHLEDRPRDAEVNGLHDSLDEPAEGDDEGDYLPRDFADWREIPSEALQTSGLGQALSLVRAENRQAVQQAQGSRCCPDSRKGTVGHSVGTLRTSALLSSRFVGSALLCRLSLKSLRESKGKKTTPCGSEISRCSTRNAAGKF